MILVKKNNEPNVQNVKVKDLFTVMLPYLLKNQHFECLNIATEGLNNSDVLDNECTI